MKFKELQKYWYSKFEKRRANKKTIPIAKFPAVIEYNCEFTNLQEFNQVCVDFLIDYYIPKNPESEKKIESVSEKSSFWHSFTKLFTALVD